MKLLLLVIAVALAANAAPSTKGLRKSKPKMPSNKAAREGFAPDVSSAKLGVVHGRDAVLGQFPYMALVTMDASSLCGGALITDTFVLTAAQCVAGYSQYQVVVGEIDMFFMDSPTMEYAFTYKSIVHEDFEEDRMANDIGLIQLLRPVTLVDGAVALVSLPTPADASNTFVGKTATLSGWDDPYGFSLQYAQQPVMDAARCGRFFGTFQVDDLPIVNETIHICGDGEGHVGACGDDLGSPLVIQDDDGSFKLIGISSFESDLGCDYQYPSVYTRVSAYLDWIAENTKP